MHIFVKYSESHQSLTRSGIGIFCNRNMQNLLNKSHSFICRGIDIRVIYSHKYYISYNVKCALFLMNFIFNILFLLQNQQSGVRAMLIPCYLTDISKLEFCFCVLLLFFALLLTVFCILYCMCK